MSTNTNTNAEYGADQIQILEGLEAVRKRPGMYIGSTSLRGLHHLVYEIVDNSVDEAWAGYCDTIEVHVLKGNCIRVTDNGCGMEEEELSRITEAFYMVDKARSRKQHGAGLGLALADRIARIHGSGLEFRSRKGQGTEVSLLFSCVEAETDDEE